MSTLNKNLAKVSKIAFLYQANASADWPADYHIMAPNGLSNVISYYTTQYTGNNDIVSFKVGIKQPSNRKDPYQVQYRMHSRYIPSIAKKKGSDWTDYTTWSSPMPTINGIEKGTTTNPNTWDKPNLGINKNSADMVILTYQKNWSQIGGTGTNFDARSYQFRVRTINVASKKHGEWVYSEWLKVYKNPRMANATLYAEDDGSLRLVCNIRYADRGGVFYFPHVVDSNSRSLIKYADYKAKMIRDTTRTASSVPPKREGFVPCSCVIPLASLKRSVKRGETLYFSLGTAFESNDKQGEAPLHVNLPSSAPVKTIGGVPYYGLRVQNTDITLNKLRLVLTTSIDRGFVVARAYKTDPDDNVIGLTAVMTYKYEGKNYTVKPHYAELHLARNSTRQCVGYWIFTKVPFGVKVGVKATATNTVGKKAEVSNAITLQDTGFWYIQKESSPSVGGVLQWNCKVENGTTINRLLETTHGRTKPFVVYGNTTTRELTISGEVPTQTQNSIFSSFASRSAWTKVQNNLGIYIVRGSGGRMYRLALSEVSISDQADTEIMTVRVRGTEVD